MGLFNSTVLDVIIGLVFVYLLLAILCTAANEWVAALTRRRGKMLAKGITQLLSDPDLLKAFYQHPLIRSLRHDDNHPAYLSPRTFTSVILDLISPGSRELADVRTSAAQLPESDVKASLTALLNRSDIQTSEEAIEAWFNDAMDRVTGWYKRRTQVWTVVIALGLTLFANADTIQIARRLWSDPALRAAVVEEAKVRAQKPRPTISVEYEDEQDPTQPTITKNEGNTLSDKERDILGQLLGWQGGWSDFKKALPGVLVGWLLTILAISLGAPFWFDMLNKFVNIRYSGKSPDEKPKGPEKPAAAPART
jgi:hypothetical protein